METGHLGLSTQHLEGSMSLRAGAGNPGYLGSSYSKGGQGGRTAGFSAPGSGREVGAAGWSPDAWALSAARAGGESREPDAWVRLPRLLGAGSGVSWLLPGCLGSLPSLGGEWGLRAGGSTPRLDQKEHPGVQAPSPTAPPCPHCKHLGWAFPPTSTPQAWLCLGHMTPPVH